MNKKLSSVLTLLTLVVFLAVAAPASAAFNTYTVGSNGSTTLKGTFSFNETPYLYMQLPNNLPSSVQSWWNAPSTSIYFASGPVNTTNERWLSLANWGSVKEVGDWTIDSNVFYARSGASPAGSLLDSTSFTVTPEPLAMTLFLLGGAPIAVNLYRKRRPSKV